MSEQVHIWSDEHKAFWRPNGNGYAVRAEDAGVWNREDAQRRIRGCGPEKKLSLIPARTTQTLDRVSRETIILNAHRLSGRKFRGQPLWAFITEVCAVGSTSAIEICRECGWNPHQDGGVQLRRGGADLRHDPNASEWSVRDTGPERFVDHKCGGLLNVSNLKCGHAGRRWRGRSTYG